MLRRSMTDAERILWSRLQANRLRGRQFRKQHAIAGFIVDFYCYSAKLVVEVDGPAHDCQTEYDDERDALLLSLGLHILRFTNDQVKTNLREVMLTIYRALG